MISTSGVYRDVDGRSLDNAARDGFPRLPEAIPETQPTVDPGPETYASRKVSIERRMLDGAQRPVTILRPGAIYGPHSRHPREWWFVKRILDGRIRIPLAYGGNSRFHPAAVGELARLVHGAVRWPGTRILNAADAKAPTALEIGSAICSHLSFRGTLVPIDAGDDRGNAHVGWSPWSVARPFVLSTSAAAELGHAPTSVYGTQVGPVIDLLARQPPRCWKEAFPILASYPRDLFDYAAEDAYFDGRKS